MNLKQAKKILDKINTLYSNMSIDDHVSPIEKDLMMDYIRQFYDSFLDDTSTPSVSKKATKKTTRVSPPPVVEEPVVPVVEEIPAPVVRKKPVVIEIPDSLKEYTQQTPPPPPKAKVATPAPPKVEPAPPVVEPTPVVAAPKVVTPQETKAHDPLFEMPEAKELSDRLASAPIKDLTKAMGLNEKILTINELFGGDHRSFDDTIKYLNTLNSFDDAKAYLSDNVAERFGWGDKSKKKKAQIFIKLIKRRYK